MKINRNFKEGQTIWGFHSHFSTVDDRHSYSPDSIFEPRPYICKPHIYDHPFAERTREGDMGSIIYCANGCGEDFFATKEEALDFINSERIKKIMIGYLSEQKKDLLDRIKNFDVLIGKLKICHLIKRTSG